MPARAGRATRVGDVLSALGVVLVLCGTVLPWLRLPKVTVWAWDFSVLWPLLGRAGVLGTPPPTAGVVLVLGLVLAVPILFRARMPGVVASALSAIVLGLCLLTMFRLRLVHGAMHVGLASCLAGAILLNAGSILSPA